LTDLDKIYIYRITHVDNIPHILRHGITHRNSQNANSKYIPIGDSSLIGNRNTKEVLVTNGLEGDGDFEKITIGNYIPFYFGFRTPMLYVIQKGGNFVPKVTPPEDIIYCVSSVQKTIDDGMLFFFTDGQATNNLTTFFDREKVYDLNKLVDLKATSSKYWKDDLDLDLKRRKESEFLVKNDVSNSSLIGYICYNENAKSKLLNMGLQEKQVVIRPNYYF
jgi:ssDNA thymidine ADP-ribosyltransferase, DarT